MASISGNDFDPFNYKITHKSLSLVLSAPHRSDDIAILKALNEPGVNGNLASVPFPYTESDREFWYQTTQDASDQCRQEWVDLLQDRTSSSSHRKWVGGGQWVSIIRAEAPGSEPLAHRSIQPFIGEITVRRSGFPEISDVESQRKAAEANAALPAGDPSIVWEIGFYLIPEYHGRGIMPTVLASLIEQVLIPYMNVHRLIGSYFEHNVASRRVFEKCGFQFLAFVPKAVTLPEVKFKASGFKDREIAIGVMHWQRDGPT